MSTMQDMRRGAVASIPMIIGGIPFGLLFGSLASSYGLSPWFAVAMSAFVFAGSAQFVALGLIGLHAPIWVIVSTTFIVNLRHLLYAADLVKFVKHLPMSMRVIMGFGLIDETYAAVRPMYEVGSADKKNGHKVYLGSFLSFYVMWNVTTILGVLSGELIPGMSEWGLEFAMVATFIGIITPYLKHKAFWLCLLSAGASSIILAGLPNNLGLLASAVIGVAMGFISDPSYKVTSKLDDSIQEVNK
ncbi:branched-chain amino acid ABC transporter permease [Marinomonas rhizomae]|uniref:4-azaleucine resistance transporter AzlC n=1 Tax=Marinomonas rhizomae TaxID=491948 RepID=A0A366JFF9_9GAMM|nr:AzlC family ABC transporter permease [Marinomonas rhizomae]RBP84598.1 4-azaleucine resistance transporter AzlC [Marinomonas rhizomae]RNF75197.1 branched-chain amino acid ABC transporter permease [Marinomonas rhizomae]